MLSLENVQHLIFTYNHGCCNLYDVNKNLSSIYANPYFYPKATQGDRNGIHICLNNPWYYASGPDRRAKYQKAPGVWAQN